MKIFRITPYIPFIIAVAAIAIGSQAIMPRPAAALGCQITNVSIAPTADPIDPQRPQAPTGWFTSLRPPMTVTVTTNGFVCKNKTIPAGSLRLVDAESYSGFFSTTGEVWSNPETWYITEDVFSFQLTPNTISCEPENRNPDCQYILVVDPSGSNNEYRYPNVPGDESQGWGFNCPVIDGSVNCGGNPAPFALLGTPVGVQTSAQIDATNIEETIDTESPCYDATLNNGTGGYDPKCYELISDFPLLDQMNQQVRRVVFGAPNTIGGMFNALFRFIVGAAGILAVIMIIVEAWRYMTTDKVDLKTLLKGRILNIVLGLVLLLGVVVVLQTINPDLLRLEPGIPNLDISVEGDSSAPNVSVGTGQGNVSLSTVSNTGLLCPGTGGKAVLPQIIDSLWQNRSDFTYNQALRGGTCGGGTMCTDCSFTATQLLLKCAGITSVQGNTTATLFVSSQPNIEPVSSLTKQGNQYFVNGKELKVGDLLGWKAADDVPGKDQNSGHVVMYIGNGKTIESHGPTDSIGNTIHKYGVDQIYWKNGRKSYRWIIRIP